MGAGDTAEFTDLEPLTTFGLQCVTVLDYRTQKPLAMLKLPAELTLPGKFDKADLSGGAEPYIVEAERTFAKGDAALKFHQVDEELFSLFGNATMTNSAANATGSVDTPVNVVGTSVWTDGGASTTGVVEIAVKSGKTADLKAGRYRLEATAAAKFELRAMSDADFDGSPDGGVAGAVTDKGGLIASDVTLTSSAVEVVGYGITIKGAATPSMTIGDAITFEVNPINILSISGVVGMNPPKLTQVSLYISTQKSEDGKIFNFYVPKARPFGFDMPLVEYKYAEPAPGLEIMYSRTKKMLYSWKMWKRMLG